MSSAGVVGLMIGSLIGGKLISRGRRKAALIFDVVCLIGAGIA